MIYFIQDQGGAIKIGYTQTGDIKKRLEALQTGNPRKLGLLGMMEGDRSKERGLHQLFSGMNIRGEWFTSTPELLEYIWENASIEVVGDVISWSVLITMEPRLAGLHAEISAFRDDPEWPTFCANALWYNSEIKPEYQKRCIQILTADQILSGARISKLPPEAYVHRAYRDRMIELVGWYAEKNILILKTEAAYDLAYEVLYDALPDCRNCMCFE